MLKILVKTPLNPFTGYGNDGIGLITALMDAGLDVYLDPLYVAPPLPAHVASLLTKRQQAPFDLLIHHHDPIHAGISPEARRACKAAIYWTMWEYDSLDNCPRRSTLRKRFRDYDAVFGYDNVSTTALGPYVKASNLATLQGGFFPSDWPKAERDWRSDRFGFCMVGALHERKDPFVAIEAFRELKQEHPEEFEPAELHLKTNVPGLHQAMQEWVPKLRVHYNVWPADVLREFYASQHCLLAPSRGEGKNMPALEFLSTGGAVIATNWGGHTQWLSPSYAYPLNYTLVPLSPATPNCHNARADKDHLKALMLHVFRNRAEAASKGDLAARLIPEMCSWDAVVRRMFDKLRASVPGGDTMLHGAREARQRMEARAKGVPALV